MKLRNFIFGYALVLAVFLFAKHREAPQASPSFRRVVDLTQTVGSSYGVSGTMLGAPAQYARGLWTVDQIPAERLIAPLVVLDVREQAQKNSAYQVSVEDIANWEQVHGEIPPGALVVAETGKASAREPEYSPDAAQFLVEGRNIVALGTDTNATTSNAVANYTLAHSVYQLQNIANLDAVPASGSVVVIAPEKLHNAKTAPVRMLAMVR
jgi:kynurenine formamidase